MGVTLKAEAAGGSRIARGASGMTAGWGLIGTDGEQGLTGRRAPPAAAGTGSAAGDHLPRRHPGRALRGPGPTTRRASDLTREFA